MSALSADDSSYTYLVVFTKDNLKHMTCLIRWVMMRTEWKGKLRTVDVTTVRVINLVLF